MPPPDDHPRPPGRRRENGPLGDYARRTGVGGGFFGDLLGYWLGIAEGLLVLGLAFPVAIHIVKATMVPKGELGFGGVIFVIPIVLLALLLGALPMALLRGLLAGSPWLRLLVNMGMAVAFVFGVLGVDLQPPKPASKLHAAAEAGTILAPDPAPAATDLEARDQDGRTPLAVAVRRAALERPETAARMALVQQLLERGADVNTRDKEGRTPLFYAYQHPRLLELLAAHGADPNLGYPEMAGSNEPCHSIWYWVSRGSPERLVAVADRFPHLAVPQDRKGKPLAGPLYDVTVLAHQPAMVRYFLGRGFDPNETSDRCAFGKTPLHNVVQWPEPEAREAIDLLLAAGARIDARARGQTPLMVAGSRPETVRYLIARGADINAMDSSSGRSVLDYYEYWQQAESARLLREAGALTGDELRAAQVRARAGK